MKSTRIVLFGLGLCLLLGQPLPGPRTVSAQSAEGRYEPFVSRIQAEARNNLVRLSWLDSPEATGPVYIYRSRNEFNKNNPYSRIQPIEVPHGVQSYIDEVVDFGTWYYFIAASDGAGYRYAAPLPLDNTISVAVNAPEDSAVTGLWDLEGPVVTDSGIDALTAMIRDEGVALSFNLTRPVRRAVLYRSIKPITRTQDLLGAVLVQSGITAPFMDYPVPGIAYYYAVITEEELISGGVQIVPGHNATTAAVTVPQGTRVGLRASPEIRSIPLPMMAVNAVSRRADSFSAPPRLTPLSPRAEQATAGFKHPESLNKAPVKAPRAFSQDLGKLSGGGEDYALKTIVQGPFLRREWTAARDELVHYLSLPRSPAAEGRARFYLGQSYYYCGTYREALFQFLQVQNTHSAEAAEWIQVTLSALNKK